jgi:hypothetical protein
MRKKAEAREMTAKNKSSARLPELRLLWKLDREVS